MHCLEEKQNNKKQLKQIKTADPSATGEQTQQVKAKNEYCFKYPRTRKERPTECARCDEHFYTSESWELEKPRTGCRSNVRSAVSDKSVTKH